MASQKYINEEDAVREVLMALQGRKNIVLEWRDDENGEGSYTVSLALQLSATILILFL